MGKDQQFEFLDIITILGFAMQVQNAANVSNQATNNDLLEELHRDVAMLNSKLDRLLSLAEGNNTDVDKHPWSAQ